MKNEDFNLNWMDQCTGLLFCHIVESESKVNLTINRLVALCPTSSTVAVASLVVVETANIFEHVLCDLIGYFIVMSVPGCICNVVR